MRSRAVLFDADGVLVDPSGGTASPLHAGVPELLARLPARGWAVVTSGRAGAVRTRLQAGGAPDPAVVVDGGVVLRSKPHPECYLLAADVLGAHPEDCLVVEGTPTGVDAGRAAGMRVLALTTMHPAEALGRAHELAPSIVLARRRICAWVRDGPTRTGRGGALVDESCRPEVSPPP